MNRRQRRSAAKANRHAPPARHGAPASRDMPPDSTGQAEPGLFLRLFARIVLSPWILKRVNHADVERLLAGVALQAGRPEVARELLSRSGSRK